MGFQSALRRIAIDRADAFDRQVSRHLSGLEDGRPTLRYCFELFRAYIAAFRLEVDDAWDSGDGDVETLRNLIAHLRSRIAFFDDRFNRGLGRVPPTIRSAVEAACRDFGVETDNVIVTVGPPGNFKTFVDDLYRRLFREISNRPSLAAHLRSFKPIIITIPDIEGTRAPWQPVVVGHELAHYFQQRRAIIHNVSIESLFDPRMLERLRGLEGAVRSNESHGRLSQQAARNWLVELSCDAYTIHRYGAGGLAALAEFLESVRATDVVSLTHPPASLRVQLMLGWLGAQSAEEAEITAAFEGFAAPASTNPWLRVMSEIFISVSDELWAAVASWVGKPPYASRGRSGVIRWLAHQFSLGVPGGESCTLDGKYTAIQAADVINACWLALTRETEMPVHRLAAKALDDLDFIDKWQAAGGQPADYRSDEVARVYTGALAEVSIRARLNSSGDRAIVVTPQLPNSIRGASLDLRLGNKFIVFERSAASSFDALASSQDPRTMQSDVEKAWGDTFNLHPGQLVLASTLEFIVLPADLTAQVVTRSSYGRLGLISATAVQVHPRYAGCLTLELVNLGEMPLTITPGERIAQLLLFETSDDGIESEPKYKFPTGPEFSKIQSDQEAEVLREMRSEFRRRRQYTPNGP